MNAVVASFGILACLCQAWFATTNAEMALFDENSRIIFSVVVGYFAADLVVTIVFKFAYWQVFIAHHVFALCPYAFYLFGKSCSQSNGTCLTYGLASFLLVEFSTLPVNALDFLTQTGYGDSSMAIIAFYALYLIWIPTRLYVPWNILFFTVRVIYPLWGWQPCAVSSYAGCAFIVVFCTYIFFAMHTPAMYRRWVPRSIETKSNQESISLLESQPVYVSLDETRK